MLKVIDGVVIKPLKIIPDERGAIFHMMREDDPLFEHFGEIYFSMAYPNVVKGWHLHKRMTLNYAVIKGMIKLVIYDSRPDSPSKGTLMELFVGEKNYALVKIPPQVWNGFKCIGNEPAIVANCSTLAYDPEEIVRLDPLSPDIPYDWSLRNR